MWRFSVCTRVKSSSQWLIQTGISTEMLCLYSFKGGLVTGPLLPSEEGPCLLWKGLRGPLCAGFRPRSGKARGRVSPSRSGPCVLRWDHSSPGIWGLPGTPGSGLTWAGAVGASPKSWEGKAATPWNRHCTGHWPGCQVRQTGADLSSHTPAQPCDLEEANSFHGIQFLQRNQWP